MDRDSIDHNIVKFHNGTLDDAYNFLGSHLVYDEGEIVGATFCVYEPYAINVCVIRDGCNPCSMNKISDEGFWFLYLPSVNEGDKYQYLITTQDEAEIIKSDSFAFYTTENKSVILDIENYYEWYDEDYMHFRKNRNYQEEPLVIYELDINNWKKSITTYQDLSKELIPYLIEHGFTHVELISLLNEGILAPNSQFGEGKSLMSFIDECHTHNIGIFLDFPSAYFEDVIKGITKNNQNADLSEYLSILVSALSFWCLYYHIDGIRLNNLSDIIYFQGDISHGINLKGLKFLRTLNDRLSNLHPDILLIAGETIDFPNVTRRVCDHGLGFHYQWDNGWMKDILDFFEEEPLFRKYLSYNLNLSLMRPFSQKTIIPLAHTMFNIRKTALIKRMSGDLTERFQNLRVLIGLLFTYPGKKLLYMGNEFAQMNDYYGSYELDWYLYQYSPHILYNNYIKALIKLYREEKALYETDHSKSGFIWINQDHEEHSVFSYVRLSKNHKEILIIVINTTPLLYKEYKLGVPYQGEFKEILNSNHEDFGGNHIVNDGIIATTEENYLGFKYTLKLCLPPLGIIVLKRTSN